MGDVYLVYLEFDWKHVYLCVSAPLKLWIHIFKPSTALQPQDHRLTQGPRVPAFSSPYVGRGWRSRVGHFVRSQRRRERFARFGIVGLLKAQTDTPNQRGGV